MLGLIRGLPDIIDCSEAKFARWFVVVDLFGKRRVRWFEAVGIEWSASAIIIISDK